MKNSQGREPYPYPEVMTLGEVANYLRMSPAAVYKMTAKRLIPGVKINRAWRFHKDVIDDWLKTLIAKHGGFKGEVLDQEGRAKKYNLLI